MTTTTPAEPGYDVQTIAAPATSDAGDPGWFTRVTARPRRVVGVAATVAGVWAIVGSRVLFPYLSNNHDEAVYLLQASAIEHGHLFPKAGATPEAFLPWLSAQEGHHFVPKYAPVYPVMLALGKWVFTSERISLGIIAAGVIIMTYLLATEVLENRRHAALASVFMLFTPLFVIQSATFLPYTAGLLLLTTFAYGLLRGLRVERPGWLVLAGIAFGLAFFARPYDALLFMIPMAGYVIVRYRRQFRLLLTRAAWVILGLVPPAIAMAAFNHAATGSTLESPFSLIDSRDTIGFGSRSMDPNNSAVHYTPGLGWTGLSRHVMLTMFWVFGGLVLVGCALYYLSRHRWRGKAAWLGAVALAIPIGYLFFWGTYGAAVWGAPWYLGPYYYMPIFAPLAILGAGGFIAFLAEFRKIAMWALVGMLLLSIGVTTQAIVKNWSFTEDDHRLYSGLENAHIHNAIVFLPGYYGPRVLHPFATARNSWNTTGDVLYAVDRGSGDNAAVVAAYPKRTPYYLTILGNYRKSTPDPNLRSILQPMQVMRGNSVQLGIDFPNPNKNKVVSITISINGRADTFVVDTSARQGTREHLDVNVTPARTTTSGHVLLHTTAPSDADISQLQVTIASSPSPATPLQAFYFRRLGIVRSGSHYVLIAPGEIINGVLDPDPVSISMR